MLKKFNVFILVVFLLGQTIIGPIGSSAGFVLADESEKEGEETSEEVEEVEEVDKTALEEALQDADNYAEEDYTADSYVDFVKAVTAGQKTYDKADVAQEDVNDAVDEIKDAVQALQQKTSTEEDGDDNVDANSEGEENTEPEEEETKGDDKTPSMQAMSGVQTLAEYVDEITLTDDDHVAGFSFTIDDVDYKEANISNGDPFKLKIDFSTISNELDYGPGTVLKYELPESFLDNFSNLKVPGTFGGVGTIEIDGGFVVITLNDGVMIGDTVSDITDGYLTIEGIFSEDNDKWEKEIALPQGEKFTVNFVPKSGQGDTINKEDGTPNKNGQKSDKIEWKVTVNTNLANTADNPVFTDKLSSNATGHKYDTGSVEIREINVRPNGDTTVGDIAQGITPQFNGDNTEMTINLEKGKAYEITYTTIPENPGTNENVTYNNEANYDGTTDRGSAYVDFGKAIEKTTSGPDSDLETEWTIKYNYNEQTIPSGTTVEDKWTTSGTSQANTNQILIDGNDGITIEGVDGGPSLSQGDYTVNYNETEQKFELTFNKEFDYPINIKYKTKPNDDLKASEDFTVKNEVDHGHIPGAEDSKTVEYNQTSFTLVKNKQGNLNYEDKTMDWSITANQAEYPLDAGTKFVDSFGNENMVLVEDSLIVNVGGQELDRGTDYNLTNNNEEGFVIELVNGTSEQIEITYQTSFDQIKGTIDEDRKHNYPNHVVLEDSGLPTDPEDDAEHNSNDEQKVNGNKTGEYNYETKKFTWEILFNYNSNTLNDAVFKDALPEEHEITEFTLEKGHINSDGNFVKDEDVSFDSDIIGTNAFTLNLGQIDQPYRVKYTTVMKDGVLPVDGENNYSVTNEAELLDGDRSNAKWERTVTVQNSQKELDQKNGRQISDTGIAWNFLYNTAQSELKDVVIKDTFGLDEGMVNQLIDESSVKVYKATYSGTSSSIDKTAELLEEGTDYTLEFDKDDATFVLSFDKLDYAIYVEYESTFIGLKDSPISNELTVSFDDGEKKTGSSNVPSLNFTYGAHASISAGEFVVIKTDEATGEAMKDVEFTLKDRTGRKLLAGTTDENGVLDFEMPFATGTYYLDEEKQEGYEELKDYEFILTADGGTFDGKQVVNITNTPDDPDLQMCPDFTITVKDVEGNEEANKSVKLVNEKTGQVFEETTGGDGKIVKDRENLPAGNYKVYEVDGDDEIYINDIEVKYVGEDNTECNAEVRPAIINIPVEKVWEDSGKERPDSITVELTSNSADVDSQIATLNVDSEWKHTFDNLRQYDFAGEKITYNVEEVTVPKGYTSEKTGNAEEGFIITNTQETTEVEVTKVWEEVDSQYRPQSIELILKGNENVVDSYTLKGSSNNNEWSYTFTNLPVYNKAGEKIEYTVEEVALTGYEVNTTGNAKEGFTLTNTQQVIDIEGTKTWQDEESSANRPDNITIQVLIKDTETVVAEKEISTTKNETYKFENLPEYNENGEQIEYVINELNVPGYEANIEDFNITNTRTDDTNISVTKKWLDEDENDRPTSITVQLYQNNKVFGEEVEITPDSDGNWTYTFENLDQFDTDGKPFAYTVEEVNLDEKYEAQAPQWIAEDNGYVITNVRTGTTEVSGTKTWIDTEENAARPEDGITVRLYANREEVDDQEVTPDATTGDWTYSFTDLPQFDDEGKAIDYIVTEDQVDGYNSAIIPTELGFNIENTRQTYAIGDYVWVDRNKDGIQDENEEVLEGVIVELYDEDGEKIAETTTNEDGLYIFDELVAGDYQVKFTLTEEQEKQYRFTQQNAGDYTTVDSDADVETGLTKVIELNDDNSYLTKDYDAQEFNATEGIDPTWDAGVIELVDVTITKTWEDEDDSTRPASITVDLLANKEKVSEHEITAGNDWTLTVKGLDKYDAAGKVIVYTVEEHEVSEYNSTVDGTDITNTQKTYAIGDYVWIDSNKDGLQDENEEILEGVKVELIDEEGKVIETTETDEDGRYIFDELPAGDYKVKFTLTEEQGKKYRFTEEQAGDDTTVDSDANADEEYGWTRVIELNEDNDYLTLNEDYEYQEVEASEGIDPTWDAGVIELVDVSGTKTWVNDHNESEELPTSITINLLANGEEVDSVDVTDEDDWTYSFTGLDKYDENGEEIDYSVTEDAVDGYETSYDGNNITNTKLCENFTVEVEDEEGNPVTEEEFTFESEDGKKITKKTDKDGKVTFDREELPEGKYTVKDKDGNKVGEIDVEYNVDCEDNVTKVIVPVEKPEDPKTCEEVEITITEDGKPSKNKTYTLTSKDGKTKVTITTDKDGKVTIDRDKLPNGKYTVTDKDGNVVGEVEVTDSCYVELDIKSTSTIGSILPKTATQIFSYIALGLGLIGLGFAVKFTRRRKNA